MGLFDEYQASNGDYPDSWKPADVGDSVIGTVARVNKRQTRFGDKVVITFTDVTYVEGGATKSATELDWWVSATNSAGNSPQPLVALNESGADAGDTIKVALDELRDTGKGNPMKVYTVTLAEGASAAASSGTSDPFG